MGIIRNKDLVMRLGEFPVKANETFYGGSPLAIEEASSSIVLAKAANLKAAVGSGTAHRYLGIAWSTSSEYAKTMGNIGTALFGPEIITFCKLTKATQSSPYNYSNVGGTPGIEGDDYPYDAVSVTWAVGDRLYIGATGLWTNIPASANDPWYGFVRAKSTNYLEVILYGSPMYQNF